jgi:hypothetical protein
MFDIDELQKEVNDRRIEELKNLILGEALITIKYTSNGVRIFHPVLTEQECNEYLNTKIKDFSKRMIFKYNPDKTFGYIKFLKTK